MRTAFLELLKGEQPDEIVWTADISYWMEGRRRDGTYDPDWDTEEGYLRLHRRLGIFPYVYYPKFFAFAAHHDDSVRISFEQSGNVNRRRIQTPAGDLIEESTYLPESCCGACTKHAVESAADLDVLLYVLNHRRLIPAYLDDYAQRLSMWEAYDGVPAIGLPRSPLSCFCYEWVGVENMVYLVADHEDKVRAALQLMNRQEEPILDAVCRAGLPVVHFPDNLTSETLTGLYDAFMAPGHRRRIGRLHEAGVCCAVHLDGAVKGLLPKLAAAGFDAVEALTPKPTGDIDMAEMRALVGSRRVILWGGVPGAMFAPPYTWDDMERHVEQLRSSWKGCPFIVGVADQVPPDGDIEFCRKIAHLLLSTPGPGGSTPRGTAATERLEPC